MAENYEECKKSLKEYYSILERRLKFAEEGLEFMGGRVTSEDEKNGRGDSKRQLIAPSVNEIIAYKNSIVDLLKYFPELKQLEGKK